MKSTPDTSREEKQAREKAAADYKAARWTLLYALTSRGGGKARMVRGG